MADQTPALSEDKRRQLDGIVSQMESNQESPENIQFVVDDFKKKYAGASATPTSPAESSSHLDAVGRGLSNFWEQINPVSAIQGVGQILTTDPRKTISAIGQAQGKLYYEAGDAFKKGDYVTGARKAINYLLPLIGPALDAQSEKGAQGDIAGMVGGSVGIGANIAAPQIIGAALPTITKAVKVLPGLGVARPAAAAMTARAQALGIPVDAATVTENTVVQAAKFGADRTLVGSKIAANAEAAQAEGATQAIGKISKSLSTAPQTPETAGAALRKGLSDEIAAQHGTANTAYDALRTIEQQRPIPVDVSNVKRLLQPIRDRMYRQLPVTLRANSPGFTALEQLLAGPDQVPLSVLDSDLSVIKAMAREADPNLRSAGQGIAARTSSLVDAEIQKAAAKAGPDALKALHEGRAATKAKYAAADVLGEFAEEPVKAFNQAVLRDDAGIDRLRSVQKVTPKALPQMGRAYLDDLVTEATQQGGFGGQKALSQWQNLGPETKKLLFPDPDMRADLDAIFHTMRKAAANPNPSGTAHTAFMYGELLHLAVSPTSAVPLQVAGATVSKLLRTKAGIRILRDGLILPMSHPGAIKAAQQIAETQAQTVGHMLSPSAVPVAAEDQTPAPQ